MKSQTPWQHRLWRAFYDHVAFAYDATLQFADRLHLGNEGRIRRQVIAPLRFPSSARLLEIGCGTAANRLHLPAEFIYIGLDSSLNMLRRARARCARRNLRAHFVQGDAQAIPFQQASMDQVLAMGVLQHVVKPASSLTEMRRVAKPGAKLLIIDERRAASRIFPHLSMSEPLMTFGEYFVTVI